MNGYREVAKHAELPLFYSPVLTCKSQKEQVELLRKSKERVHFILSSLFFHNSSSRFIKFEYEKNKTVRKNNSNNAESETRTELEKNESCIFDEKEQEKFLLF